MPESHAEIIRIIESLKELDKGVNVNNIYDMLFEKYSEKGGDKNY